MLKKLYDKAKAILWKPYGKAKAILKKLYNRVKVALCGSPYSYDREFMELIEGVPLELLELEGISPDQLDFNKSAKKFLKNPNATADVSVDANANVDTKDVVGYTYELPKPLFKLNSLYILWDKLKELYGLAEANRIILAQLYGEIYINDSSDLGKPYCFNYSTYDIALEGLPMIRKIKSSAPKSLYAFKSQVEQFIIIASNSTLGATGLADLLVCMGMYVDKILKSSKEPPFKDHNITVGNNTEDVWNYVDETITSIIYTLNQPMRGNQSPFTNVSLFDRTFLEELCPDYSLPGEDSVSLETVMKIQEIYMKVMNREMRRTPITFPVTTPCFAMVDGKIVDQDFVQKVAKESEEWGFMNFYTGKTSTLSSCCRLRSDTDSEYFNSFGSGSTKIGSLGVVTLPLRRYAEEADGNFNLLMAKVTSYSTMAIKINHAKRKIIESRIARGNMPLYTHGHMDLSKQYSTIGITGFYEALAYCGVSLETDGLPKAKYIVELLNRTCSEAEEMLGAPHNLEQVPAESSAIKLANKAAVCGLNKEDISFYSNQYIPATSHVDLLTRIRVQGELDGDFSGGSIMHINLEDTLTAEQYSDLINECASKGVVYWAANYNIKECSDGHMFTGDICQCGKEADSIYTRVVGFLTKVANWNKVRRDEDHPERVRY